MQEVGDVGDGDEAGAVGGDDLGGERGERRAGGGEEGRELGVLRRLVVAAVRPAG